MPFSLSYKPIKSEGNKNKHIGLLLDGNLGIPVVVNLISLEMPTFLLCTHVSQFHQSQFLSVLLLLS